MLFRFPMCFLVVFVAELRMNRILITNSPCDAVTLGSGESVRRYMYREIKRENRTVSFILTVDLSMRAECMNEK